MFTGIIERVATVGSAELSESGAVEPRFQKSIRLRIETGFPDLVLGESVAVNGTCLTVAELGVGGRADFFVSGETLDRTNLGRLREGSVVNLERSVALGGRLSGHWVQGHVDGLAVLSRVVPGDGSYDVEFDLPISLARFCVEKGSIAINGTSLTINRVTNRDGICRIAVVLVPHTWTNTNLSQLKAGDPVNIEVDILAKYLAKQLENYSGTLCNPLPAL